MRDKYSYSVKIALSMDQLIVLIENENRFGHLLDVLAGPY